jgi:hypothetical protein
VQLTSDRSTKPFQFSPLRERINQRNRVRSVKYSDARVKLCSVPTSVTLFIHGGVAASRGVFKSGHSPARRVQSSFRHLIRVLQIVAHLRSNFLLLLKHLLKRCSSFQSVMLISSESDCCVMFSFIAGHLQCQQKEKRTCMWNICEIW